MKMRKGLLMTALITGTLMSSAVAFAEELQEYTLDQMVVTATRYEKRDVEIAADTQVINSTKIENSGATNVQQVLQAIPGIVYQSKGPGGASLGSMTSKVSMRGVETGTLVLLNGTPINYRGLYNLEDIILKEFADYPSADVIIFHLDSNSNERKLTKYSKTRRWKKYEPRPWGAVRIAFRLRAVQKANLWFSPLFGGGCVFPNGEDSMWIDSAFDANLKFYVSNKTIGYVDMSESSWFSGFDYKYFYAKGAFYQASYPRMVKIWMLYFAFRTRKMTMLTFKERLQWLEYGRLGYNSMKSYEEFKYEMK